MSPSSQQIDIEIELPEDKRKCSYCDMSIGDNALVALNRLWHFDHFFCYECKSPILSNYQVTFYYITRLNDRNTGDLLLKRLFSYVVTFSKCRI